jgi:MFS transporter, DHA1 family, multidrug resistance protein
LAVLAILIDAASLLNGKLVMTLGMRKLTMVALVISIVLAAILLLLSLSYDGKPPFWTFILLFSAIFFCTGILFGNLMALSMEPLGHIAGIGAAITSATSNLMSIPLAIFFGSLFAGTATPLIASFLILPAVGLLIMFWVEKDRS